MQVTNPVLAKIDKAAVSAAPGGRLSVELDGEEYAFSAPVVELREATRPSHVFRRVLDPHTEWGTIDAHTAERRWLLNSGTWGDLALTHRVALEMRGRRPVLTQGIAVQGDSARCSDLQARLLLGVSRVTEHEMFGEAPEMSGSGIKPMMSRNIAEARFESNWTRFGNCEWLVTSAPARSIEPTL